MSSHIFLRDYNSPNQKRLGCVAMRVDREAGAIYYAFSACSPKDRWNSKIACSAAQGRLQSHPTILGAKVPESWNEITKLIMEDIVAHNQDRNGPRSYLAFVGASAWLARPVPGIKAA